VPSLVPTAVVFCCFLEELQNSCNGGASHVTFVELSTPITELQIAPKGKGRG
jgi:hypothetical protein